MKRQTTKPGETRRQFLKSAAKKAVVPVVVVYGMTKATPKLFASD